MNPQQANDYIADLIKKGEDMYFETYPNRKREDYNPDLYPFLLGVVKADLHHQLTKKVKPSLS